MAFDVTEKSIAELLAALDDGAVSSVDLVCAYLNRIGFFDRSGVSLNAVPILNPEVFEEARASDERRAKGLSTRPLEGIPFTVKDSYKVRGLTVSCGSPAFRDLVATEDALTVRLLKEAGAVLIGKTNMPPMAAGGVQPGLYGYARSPYHPGYLTAAYGSGSSNGSGTAVAASLCAFSMAEETLSSGRSPASNNALVAYTPSRGLLSISGNWPLFPTCDVVVPYARTMDDLLHLLDVLMVPVIDVSGDFWREQDVVDLPKITDVRPVNFEEIKREGLQGVRLGVPKMFLDEDSEKLNPVTLRDSVRALWQKAEADLKSLGAEIIYTDFPLVSNYEKDRTSAQGLVERGLVSREWEQAELDVVIATSWNAFLKQNGDPRYASLADIDGDAVFPNQPANVYANAGTAFDYPRLVELTKAGLPHLTDISGYEQSLKGLEEARKLDFERWMDEQGLDALIFPAAGDVARSDLFERSESMDLALRNGVLFSNGNRAIRHLGVPTVNVPMGRMADISMPVNLTFAGRAYDDFALLGLAYAYENQTQNRVPPPLTPAIPSSSTQIGSSSEPADDVTLRTEVTVARRGGITQLRYRIVVDADIDDWASTVSVWLDGKIMIVEQLSPGIWETIGAVSDARNRVEARVLAVVKARNTDGAQVAMWEYLDL